VLYAPLLATSAGANTEPAVITFAPVILPVAVTKPPVLTLPPVTVPLTLAVPFACIPVPRTANIFALPDTLVVTIPLAIT
jgi:hypothetical protein